MPNEKHRVDYFGDDQELYELLVAKLDEFEFIRRSADRLETDIGGSDWARVVLLDVNVTGGRGFLAYECLREENAGTPIVLLIDPANRPMTQLGIGQMWNAHGMFLKPLEDLSALRDSLRQAFSRIDHWRASLVRASDYEAEFVGASFAEPDAGNPPSLAAR